jgi:hypothetical protein
MLKVSTFIPSFLSILKPAVIVLIVNLHKPQLEIYRDPDTDEARYREVHTLGEGEAVKPLALTGCEVAWWR